MKRRKMSLVPFPNSYSPSVVHVQRSYRVLINREGKEYLNVYPWVQPHIIALYIVQEYILANIIPRGSLFTERYRN